MTSPTIRRLAAADVEAAAAILTASFGPSPWDRGVRRHLALQPEGMLLAELDGRPVGMVSGVDYGPFAYVGMLGIHPAAQRRGVARTLMDAVLAWIAHRSCPLALLDATPAGAALYEQLGFVDIGTSAIATRVAATSPAELPADVALLPSSELNALAAFDAPIFGADRRAALALLQDEHPGRVLVTRDAAGGITGYAVAQARAIGPWVAQTRDAAEALLCAALTRAFDEPPRVLIPAGASDARPLLERHGFQVQRELRVMQWGTGRRSGQPALCYGLASFALG